MWFVKRSSGVGVCQRHRNIAIINGGKSHFAEQTGSKLWLQWGVGCLFSTPALLVITHADWYSCGAMSSWKGLWTRLAVSAYKDRCVCWEWVGTTCRGEGIGILSPSGGTVVKKVENLYAREGLRRPWPGEVLVIDNTAAVFSVCIDS